LTGTLTDELTDRAVVTCAIAGICVYVCVESVCLAVYVANGHIMAFSLPSLKPLLDTDFLPFPDIRSTRSCTLHLSSCYS